MNPTALPIILILWLILVALICLWMHKATAVEPRRMRCSRHILQKLWGLCAPIYRSEALIPKGPYCYTRISRGLVRPCPYYKEYSSKDGDYSGCLFANRYDDPCINDMVKICGVDDDIIDSGEEDAE